VPLDCIDELEKKIDALLSSLKQARSENKDIMGRIQALEKENGELKDELEAVKNDSSESRNQLKSAAEKIKSLISRLEAIE